MGQACCEAKPTVESAGEATADAVPVFGSSLKAGAVDEPELPHFGESEDQQFEDFTYKVKLDKYGGAKLGLDVDYMVERKALPIMAILGGLATSWNESCPAEQKIKKGDCIVEVNGIKGDVSAIMDACKRHQVLEMTLVRSMTYDNLLEDLERLVRAKNCGPILLRLSWHDAGVFCQGARGGCPNAAMLFAGGGEGAFPANAGLPTVAVALLRPIANKYCPYLLSHADLWALAANVAIRVMGGPDVTTRFGRTDAESAADGVESQVGRLPDGDKGADHLRDIFYAKGFDDKAIVALSGAHTVGRCHKDRSGFEGAWTENPLKFDNSYFVDLLNKSYTAHISPKGLPQHVHAKSGTIMLPSDMALLSDPSFRKHVERYARDRAAFFDDFVEAWTRLQESGCPHLREIC